MQTTLIRIVLITKDLTSRSATIETNGSLPEIIAWYDKFFKLNSELGQPYVYEQISGEFLANIEV